MASPHPLEIARLVIDQLNAMDARYSIGGSLASSFAGEPRSTLDVDIVVELDAPQAVRLAEALNAEFYVDADARQRAVRERRSTNLIHLETSIKIDLFVAGGTPLDASLLRRRQAVAAGDPPREYFIHTPEDILLQKLRWFRLGGEVSDRHWRDALGIVRVQAGRMDRTYLQEGAAVLRVEDLLERVLDAGQD